jgi:hypothetical protein
MQTLRENPSPGSLREKLIEVIQLPESELQNHIMKLNLPSAEKVRIPAGS